jgi:nucleoside-diphosphate-sugar epimerase
MTSVLVTGTSGHVGGFLARRLRAGGYGVRALVRTPEQAANARRESWVPVQGDLTRPGTLVEALNGVDFVVHSAAYMGTDAARYQAVNVEGTRALAEEALRARVDRFVQISTVSVHGEPLPPRVTEETSLTPSDPEPYCATKSQAELALKEVERRGLPLVILRPGMITHWVRSQWGSEMVERIRVRGWPKAFHPDDVMPWVHSENLAEMAWLSLTHPRAPGEAFLAVDRDVSFRDFYGPIAEALGRPVEIPDRAPNVTSTHIGKIADRLGYRAVHGFEETEEQLTDLARHPRA